MTLRMNYHFLEKHLTQFDCQHCGECCGLVPCSAKELQAVIDYAYEHGIAPKEQGIKCPWWQLDRCQVYEVRPFACRLIGHIPELPCPKGIEPAGGMLSTRNGERLRERYEKKIGGQPTRFLHAVLPNAQEIIETAMRVEFPSS